MTRWMAPGILSVVACVMTGCTLTIPGPLPVDAGPNVQRDAGYGLLITVLDQEAKLDGLLMFKDFPPKTADLMRAISKDAKTYSAALKALKQDAPPITWKSERLPVPEMEARDWIADRATVDLLSGSGPALNVELLLSQLKATEYIAALANSIAKSEPSEARLKQLDLAKEAFLKLHDQTRVQLDSALKPKPKPKDDASKTTPAST